MANEKQDAQAHEVPYASDTISDADERELAAIGKKSVLRVNFLSSHSTSATDTLTAQLLTPRHPRPIVLRRSDMGRHVQRFHFRTPERRTGRLNLWVPALLGRLGCDCGYDG
jgi:hypothetical protein